MSPIVFIGPMAAGKTTLSKATAKRLGRRYIPLDVLRYYYYAAAGMDFLEMYERPVFEQVVEFWGPYHLPAVERVLNEFPEAVIDFGAGHAHFTRPDRRARLNELVGPIADVFLILPSADLDRATQISLERDRKRLGDRWDPTREPFAEQYVRSPSFRDVAKHTIVTEGRSVEACVDEIVARISS